MTPLQQAASIASAHNQSASQSFRQCVRQEDRKLGAGRGLRIHVAAASMLFCLESYWEADIEEAEATGL